MYYVPTFHFYSVEKFAIERKPRVSGSTVLTSQFLRFKWSFQKVLLVFSATVLEGSATLLCILCILKIQTCRTSRLNYKVLAIFFQKSQSVYLSQFTLYTSMWDTLYSRFIKLLSGFKSWVVANEFLLATNVISKRQFMSNLILAWNLQIVSTISRYTQRRGKSLFCMHGRKTWVRNVLLGYLLKVS